MPVNEYAIDINTQNSAQGVFVLLTTSGRTYHRSTAEQLHPPFPQCIKWVAWKVGSHVQRAGDAEDNADISGWFQHKGMETNQKYF